MTDEDEKRDIVAMSMVLLAEGQNAVFRQGATVLEAPVALKSPRLVGDLMRFATFAASLHQYPGLDTRRARRAHPGEDVLLAAGFDFAIEVAPSSQLDNGRRVIDLDSLSGWVSYIEVAQGRIAIDQDLVARITSAAVDRVAFPSGAPGPQVGDI